MARFFAAAEQKTDDLITIGGNDFRHLHAVLRMKEGDELTVTVDGLGVFACRIESFETDRALLRVLSEVRESHEASVRVTLFQGLPKGDKLEQVIEKSVELGAKSVVLFPCRRCVSRPEGVSLVKKLARLQKIAEESAKQCGRGMIPSVTSVPAFQVAVERAAAAELPIFCYEEEKALDLRKVLEENTSASTVSVVTGPEGGFEPDEAEFAVESGMKSVTTGSRILRCETAPLCALTAVMLFTGNL